MTTIEGKLDPHAPAAPAASEKLAEDTTHVPPSDAFDAVTLSG